VPGVEIDDVLHWAGMSFQPDGLSSCFALERLTHAESIIQPALQSGHYLQLEGLFQFDSRENQVGKSSSEWVMIAKNQEALGELIYSSRWQPLKEDPSIGVWTDDFSNLLGVFQWKN